MREVLACLIRCRFLPGSFFVGALTAGVDGGLDKDDWDDDGESP